MRSVSNTALVACMCLSLSGCLGGAAGLVAGGGAWWANKEYDETVVKRELADEKNRYFAREHSKWQMDRVQLQRMRDEIGTDGVTISDINRRLLGGDLTRVIAIRSKIKDGVVTLSGNVPSEAVKRRALAIARAHPNVREVISNLRVVEVRIKSSELNDTNQFNRFERDDAPLGTK